MTRTFSSADALQRYVEELRAVAPRYAPTFEESATAAGEKRLWEVRTDSPPAAPGGYWLVVADGEDAALAQVGRSYVNVTTVKTARNRGWYARRVAVASVPAAGVVDSSA